MNVRIKTKDFELSTATRKYLDIRIKALEKLLGADSPVSRCEIELGRAAGRPRHGDHLYFAEFTIRAPRRKPVRAVNNEATINAAIDNAKAEAAKQLKKQKTVRLTDEKREGAKIKLVLKAGR
ncbi:MAG: HPF/RaiA family ribosome-associated protein [Candidatus Pacebacteria bacterium]|nr:HPF/RaiA family ribosome-associated protein [Candidatus Paceibacterota bacterium]